MRGTASIGTGKGKPSLPIEPPLKVGKLVAHAGKSSAPPGWENWPTADDAIKREPLPIASHLLTAAEWQGVAVEYGAKHLQRCGNIPNSDGLLPCGPCLQWAVEILRNEARRLGLRPSPNEE
jgi:hypothetical protein